MNGTINSCSKPEGWRLAFFRKLAQSKEATEIGVREISHDVALALKDIFQVVDFFPLAILMSLKACVCVRYKGRRYPRLVHSLFLLKKGLNFRDCGIRSTLPQNVAFFAGEEPGRGDSIVKDDSIGDSEFEAFRYFGLAPEIVEERALNTV